MGTPFDNRISLQKLEIFCLVVELQGVSRAAEQLHVAQPVVTAHIRSLQDRLGAKLLYREGHRMLVTEAGQRVYAWAKETLARTHELAHELDALRGGERGSVTMDASVTAGCYILPSVLSDFRSSHPQADITLNISDPPRLNAVVAGECDFAMIVADEVTVSELDAKRHLLDSEVLGFEQFVLVAPPDTVPEQVMSMSDLATLPLIAPPPSQIRGAGVNPMLPRDGVEQNITFELGHPEAMKRASQHGSGAVILSRRSVVAELDAGALVEIEVIDANFAYPVFLVWRSGKQFTPMQTVLADTIRETLATTLQQDPPPPGTLRG